MTSESLTTIINTVYDAVDASKAGPIKVGTHTDQFGLPLCSSSALQTFYTLLQQVVPKGVQAVESLVEMVEKREAWQPEEEAE